MFKIVGLSELLINNLILVGVPMINLNSGDAPIGKHKTEIALEFYSRSWTFFKPSLSLDLSLPYGRPPRGNPKLMGVLGISPNLIGGDLILISIPMRLRRIIYT